MAPTVQDADEFDDDFDLPLPDRPLPASGGPSFFGQPAGTSIPRSSQLPGGAHIVADTTPFKMYACLYASVVRDLKDSLQVDLCIPNIHRREASVRDRSS
jgi:hypothetical protein